MQTDQLSATFAALADPLADPLGAAFSPDSRPEKRT
jgi:hypothetical protein